jgi:hypothetical protein
VASFLNTEHPQQNDWTAVTREQNDACALQTHDAGPSGGPLHQQAVQQRALQPGGRDQRLPPSQMSGITAVQNPKFILLHPHSHRAKITVS